MANSSASLQLTRQLNRKPLNSSVETRTLTLPRVRTELRKHPVEGFSAGLVDDDNVFEWEITIFGFGTFSLSPASPNSPRLTD
jgi:ubiquitin-conjugating enzyme E2 G1